MHLSGFCLTFRTSSANLVPSPHVNGVSEHEAAGHGLGNQPGASPGGPVTLEEHSGACLPLGAVEETGSLVQSSKYLSLPQALLSVQAERRHQGVLPPLLRLVCATSYYGKYYWC